MEARHLAGVTREADVDWTIGHILDLIKKSLQVGTKPFFPFFFLNITNANHMA
jgi:hypothetical protein